PAPAFLNLGGTLMHLEEPLRASLIVDERTVGFGEGTCGDEDVRLLRRSVRRVVDHNYLLALVKKLVDDVSFCVAIEIIFNNDDRIGVAVDHRVEGGVEAMAT